MKRLFIALALTWIAVERTDRFSEEAISGPLFSTAPSPLFAPIEEALSQPYHFLSKGRQAFVFESEDRKTVIKFFNQNYYRVPWYVVFFPQRQKEKEIEKRKEREQFYRESYSLAAAHMKEETGLLYLHLAPSGNNLPSLSLRDRASRFWTIDLNRVPFVLQKKGEPFYPALEALYTAQGEKALLFAIDQFLDLIACRIRCGIADADHDVEHNFGFCDGKPFHLDPGRWRKARELSERDWWSATHRFRDWLEGKHPELISSFDAKRNALRTKELRDGPQPPISPPLQRDESLRG